jgi:hypothetical protein
MIGARFGELTVISEISQPERRGVFYLCACDCGREAIREGAYLRYQKKLGHQPCCQECLRGLRAGLWQANQDRNRETFRAMWEQFGSLYSPSWEEREISVMSELAGLDEDSRFNVRSLWDTPRPWDGDEPHASQLGAYILPLHTPEGVELRCSACVIFSRAVRACIRCGAIVCARCFAAERHRACAALLEVDRGVCLRTWEQMRDRCLDLLRVAWDAAEKLTRVADRRRLPKPAKRGEVAA